MADRPPGAVPVALVAGPDPLRGVGGHSAYVRSRARALRHAGFEPHVFVAFRACLVGAGPLLPAHRRLAETLGLAGSTAIVGFVPDSFAYLRAADLFVLPSLEEGSGSLALLEALQAEVAVVASAVDGIPEDVSDGESGLLVPPAEPAALAAAIARLLGDAPLRRALATAGHRTFERRFSRDVFIAGLGRAYAGLGVHP